jgi:predicted transcriptional regulator
MTQTEPTTTTIELELSPEEESALQETARALNTTPDAIVQQALRDMVTRIDKGEAL